MVDATNESAEQWGRLADWEEFLEDLAEVQPAWGEVVAS